MDNIIILTMAKGRRGRNYDGWVAPPLTIAALTWQILLGMAATFLFFLIITITLLRVSPWSARGPYLFLAFVTLALIASCVLSAVSMRSLVIDNITKLRLSSASSFLGAVQDAFLPAVILYLLHLRGNVLRGVKGNTVTPIASQLWKRILDWSWVTLTFIFYLVLLGYRANWYNNLLSSMLTEDLFRQYVNISRGLAYTIDALRFLLFLNVIVSMIVHFVQSKNAQARDPVTTRLLIMAAPSFMIYAILSVAVDIILNVAATTATFNIEAFILAATIIMGICGIMILVALVNTMLLPNVQWTPQKAATPMEHRGALVQ